MMTHEEKMKWQRDYRIKTRNRCTKAYEKTEKGFLMRLYRNMQSRIDGVQKSKAHLYLGKEILTREEFYEWAINSSEFKTLFKEYTEKGYLRKLAPSVDRIDSSSGYLIDNMEWVTHSENSRRGALNRHQKLNNENTTS